MHYKQWRIVSAMLLTLFFSASLVRPAGAAPDDNFSMQLKTVDHAYDPQSLSVLSDRHELLAEGDIDGKARHVVSLKSSAETSSQELHLVSAESAEVDASVLVPARALAGQFLDVDKRIHDHDATGEEVDGRSEERSAYQLAVWCLSDKAVLKTLPVNSITDRAKYLCARAANLAPIDPRPVVQGANIRLSIGETYPSGQRLVVRLRESDSSAFPLPDQLISISINGDPKMMVQTDGEGNAEVDLGNESDLLGEVQANWLYSIPPGSILSSQDGSEIYLTVDTIHERKQSNVVEHEAVTDPKAFVSMYKALALRWLSASRNGALVIYIFTGLVILGVGSIVFTIAKSAKGGKAFLAAAIAAVVAILSGVWCSSQQAKEFHPAWNRIPSTTAMSVPLKIEQVSATSKRISNRYKFAYGGACIFDKESSEYWSAWVSHRNLGPNEMIAIDLGQPRVITSIAMIPGWLDFKENYEGTGKPSRIQLFSEGGRLVETSIDERSWTSRNEPVEVDISARPLWTRVLYLRVIQIQGGKTDAAISQLALRGYSTDDVVPSLINPKRMNYRYNMETSRNCDF